MNVDGVFGGVIEKLLVDILELICVQKQQLLSQPPPKPRTHTINTRTPDTTPHRKILAQAQDES